jgi:TorA maturation chaperone TorD
VTPAQLALARARTAALLGRLLLDGFTEETLTLVRALPALADALPDMTADQLAARHHQVLILGVPPFESLFVGDSVSLGGDTSGAAATTWAAIGMKVVRHDIEADHFGLALRALGLLCAAEHDGLRDGVDVARLRALQTQVLADRLFPTWAPFQVAVSRIACSEWTAVVQLAGALIGDLAEQLDVKAAGDNAAPDDVDDMVTVLLTPSRGGLWLSAQTIREFGVVLNMPVGFGGRRRTLKNLVEGAAGHEQLGVLADAMSRELDLCAKQLGEIVGGDRWLHRLSGARGVVATLRG